MTDAMATEATTTTATTTTTTNPESLDALILAGAAALERRESVVTTSRARLNAFANAGAKIIGSFQKRPREETFSEKVNALHVETTEVIVPIVERCVKKQKQLEEAEEALSATETKTKSAEAGSAEAVPTPVVESKSDDNDLFLQILKKSVTRRTQSGDIRHLQTAVDVALDSVLEVMKREVSLATGAVNTSDIAHAATGVVHEVAAMLHFIEELGRPLTSTVEADRIDAMGLDQKEVFCWRVPDQLGTNRRDASFPRYFLDATYASYLHSRASGYRSRNLRDKLNTAGGHTRHPLLQKLQRTMLRVISAAAESALDCTEKFDSFQQELADLAELHQQLRVKNAMFMEAGRRSKSCGSGGGGRDSNNKKKSLGKIIEAILAKIEEIRGEISAIERILDHQWGADKPSWRQTPFYPVATTSEAATHANLLKEAAAEVDAMEAAAAAAAATGESSSSSDSNDEADDNDDEEGDDEDGEDEDDEVDTEAPTAPASIEEDAAESGPDDLAIEAHQP